MKVLFCSPLGQGVGGIAKWTQYILDYYKSVESNVELVHYYHNGKIVYSDSSMLARMFNGIRNYVPLLWGLRRMMKEQNFDVLHISTSASISLVKDILSVKIAQKKGVKTVVHFHFGRIPTIYKGNNWERKLLDKVVKYADKVVTMDKASYDTLKDHGYNNICLLPNPLAPAVADMINRNQHVERDERTLIFVGHVLKTKGVMELVAACKSIDNVKLELYGHITDIMRDKIIEAAGRDRDQWLFIKGEKSGEEIIKAMSSATVFVLPTYTEGFPNVIIESMACGCPIVATPVGAIPEMLDIEGKGDCGICVPPRDVSSLQNAIVYMLENRDYAVKCGLNAKARVNKLYSIDVVWNQLQNIWKNA